MDPLDFKLKVVIPDSQDYTFVTVISCNNVEQTELFVLNLKLLYFSPSTSHMPSWACNYELLNIVSGLEHSRIEQSFLLYIIFLPIDRIFRPLKNCCILAIQTSTIRSKNEEQNLFRLELNLRYISQIMSNMILGDISLVCPSKSVSHKYELPKNLPEYFEL